MEINDEYLKEFRELLSDPIIEDEFEECDGNASWLKMCSIADWFGISLDYLEKWNFESNKAAGLEIYAFIEAAVIIKKGIRSLCHILAGGKEGGKLYESFIKDKEEFFRTSKPGRFSKWEDDKYLMELRAMLGAHPFDLDETADPKSKKKRQAHWTGTVSDGEIALMTTSQDVKDEQIEIVKINLQEIEKYILSRYQILEKIVSEMKARRQSFIEKMKLEKIEIAPNVSPTEAIAILQSECERRRLFKDSSLKFRLNDMYRYFTLEITSPQNVKMVEEYRKALVPKIDEIKQILQNMEENYVFDDTLFDAEKLGLPSKYRRDYQDVVTSSPGELGIRVLRTYFNGKFDVRFSSPVEFALLIHAFLFSKKSKLKSRRR